MFRVPVDLSTQSPYIESIWTLVADWLVAGDVYYFFLLRTVSRRFATWARKLLPVLDRFGGGECVGSARWPLSHDELFLVCVLAKKRHKHWQRVALNLTYYAYPMVRYYVYTARCVVWDLANFTHPQVEHSKWFFEQVPSWCLYCRDEDEQTRFLPLLARVQWQFVSFHSWKLPSTWLRDIKADIISVDRCTILDDGGVFSVHPPAVSTVIVRNPGPGLRKLQVPPTVDFFALCHDLPNQRALQLPNLSSVHQFTLTGELAMLQTQLKALLASCRITLLNLCIIDTVFDIATTRALELIFMHLYQKYPSTTYYLVRLTGYTLITQLSAVFWHRMQKEMPFPNMRVECPHLQSQERPIGTTWQFR